MVGREIAVFMDFSFLHNVVRYGIVF